MSYPGRLELTIDIFERQGERALVLPNLTPPELVEAILQEFGRDLEYLGDAPGGYALARVADRALLEEGSPLGKQVANLERLALVERMAEPPAGARRPSRALYLRDGAAGKVYALPWVPAIIGRPDETQPNNALLAVNVAAHPMGLRVSRRHAQIVEDGGRYFVESQSSNPTSIRGAGGRETPLGAGRHPLVDGDVIVLEHSQIELKFIVRERQP